LWGRAR